MVLHENNASWFELDVKTNLTPKYDTVGTIPKSNRNGVERSKIDTPNAQIYDL